MPERNIRSNPFISILIPAAVLLLLCLCLLSACGHAEAAKAAKIPSPLPKHQWKMEPLPIRILYGLTRTV